MWIVFVGTFCVWIVFIGTFCVWIVFIGTFLCMDFVYKDILMCGLCL